MIEVTGDLWDTQRWPETTTWRCITTNGFVKKNGECVMGRGCAKEASLKYPDMPRKLGHAISTYGNKLWAWPKYMLITFPVKHQWFEKADIDLIKKSAEELLEWMETFEYDEGHQGFQGTILLPRPGCGNGQLKWEDVKPVISFLPDNVLVISR